MMIVSEDGWKRIEGSTRIEFDMTPWRTFRGFAMFGTRDLWDGHWLMLSAINDLVMSSKSYLENYFAELAAEEEED